MPPSRTRPTSSCPTATSITAGGRDLRILARPGPQHDRRAARRRRRAPPRSSAITCSPASRRTPRSCRWPNPTGSRPQARDPVPGKPQADRVDAARPAAHRSRRRGLRSPPARAPPLRRAPAAVPAHPRRARGGPRARIRDRRAPVVGAHRGASSRCSSSGRCSATWTCSSTRARLRAGVRRRQPVREGLVLATRASLRRVATPPRTGRPERHPSSTQEVIARAELE